jgi:2-oxoisovalerate dehydrogenase E1 component
VNNTKFLKNIEISVEEILNDYRIAFLSRQVSLTGRKEVFLGKAKFGIFGDGKEIPQIAMAKAFRNGDFRSGYYRDQTFMFAIGELTVRQFFSQLYAHTDLEADPSSAGRQMNAHFSTRTLDKNGDWLDLTSMKNSSSDVSPTGAQIPRLMGLGLASKYYRHNPELRKFENFSINGNEVAFGTIGNAATSEGLFWEAVNAMGVLQIPVVLAIWDDGYGISVPNEYQTTKSDIAKALAGFQRTKSEQGVEIIQVKGWDYQAVVAEFKKAADLARTEHVPSVIHVTELTQPQGHSTSGSHERYKSKERLEWEAEYDTLKKFREWILENEFALPAQLEEIEEEAVREVKNEKDAAWLAYQDSVKIFHEQAVRLIARSASVSVYKEKIKVVETDLASKRTPLIQDAIIAMRKALRAMRSENFPMKRELITWLEDAQKITYEKYNSMLYSESPYSSLLVKEVKPHYSDSSAMLDGREILNACFDAALTRDQRIIAFGEDVGKIGDVNQGMAGLQDKYGSLRVADAGIRESTIIGQGIGMALRGLRPIAEIQYLDYVIFALQTMTDDLATLQYRTKGGQKAPLIIRTRGHRLEGVWHSGSPMGMLLHSIRGIYLLTPRNMTQAAGMYNTLLQSDDAALMIECLNGYRLKEKMPDNIGEFTVPLGQPEVIREGNDITIVTYGAMCRIVMEAANQLEEYGISCEIIDVQTLLPFDIHHTIVESVKKTNRVMFADEDVPGGASSYLMQKVLEEQGGWHYLDSAPVTIAAKEHRTAYGSDGDYFSKPNVEDVFDKVYAIMSESDPQIYPDMYTES